MRRGFVRWGLFVLLVLSVLKAPCAATGINEVGTGCGMMPEVQEEFFFALLQERIQEATGISPYFVFDLPVLTPPISEARILALPIRYPDSKSITGSWETDQAYYEELLFGADKEGDIEDESLQTYFSRISYGRLHIAGDVLPVYCAGEAQISYSTDRKAYYTLVEEALASYHIDYDQYDANHDGYIDCLVLINNSDGSCSRFDPDNENFDANWAMPTSKIKIESDTIKVWSIVSIISDTDRNTYAHELCHCMGLLDNYKSAGGCELPIVHEDIMAYSDNYINMFYKYLLKWVDPVILTDNNEVEEIKLYAAETETEDQGLEPKAVLYIPNKEELPFTEFFIAEYRNGSLSEYGAKPGVTLWHCDGTLHKEAFMRWTSYLQAVCPSGIEDSLKFSEADRFVPTGEPWSAYSTSTLISPYTQVNSDFHDGVKTNFYMKVVDMNEEYATLRIGALDPGHEHAYSDWITDGTRHWRECPECGGWGELDAHTLVDDPAVVPTCTAPGRTAGSHCSVCGYVRTAQTELPALGHSYSGAWKSDRANHWQECSHCHGARKDTGPHVEDGGTVLIQPTQTKRGVIRYRCETCGFVTRTEYIPPLGLHEHSYSEAWSADGTSHWHACECGERTDQADHTPVEDAGAEPTCTTAGQTAGSHCPVCGYVIVPQTEVPAKGHDYSEQWSKDSAGHWKECAVCRDKKDAAPHVWDGGSVTKAPTAAEAGTRTYTCTVCSQTRMETIPATGGGSSSGGGGGGGHSPVRYSITVQRDPAGGKVTIAPQKAERGETVTVTVEPPEGYDIEAVEGKDSRGKELKLTEQGEGKYLFSMPGSGVTVTARFRERPAGEAPPEDKAETKETPTQPFADVKEGAWYYDAVVQAYARGIMAGVKGTEFRPETPAGRGMVAVVLYRMEGEPTPGGSGFPDVPEDRYYAAAISWAAEKGIVKGYGDGAFRPDRAVTREELAAILYRYGEYKGWDMAARADLSDYTDAEQVSSYAREALSWARAMEIISGTDWGGLHPGGSATRAELAALLLRCEVCSGK